MNHTVGLIAGTLWTRVVRRPVAAKIVGYLYNKWLEYVARFRNIGQPFQDRDEPTLTEGLAAFLADEYEAGRQVIDGDFLGELKHYDLQPDGTAKCTGRTDIEWRLFGFPAFIIEFKILDGGNHRLDLYLGHGVQRFISGRYAPRTGEGAMWALLRAGSKKDAERLEFMIADQAVGLRCHQPAGSAVVAPSRLAPSVARFDTLHFRDAPAPSPIHLAHVFVALP